MFALLAVVPAAAWAGGRDRRWWRGVFIAAAICCAVAGPFYGTLWARHGSVRAFNRPVAGDPLAWGFRPLADAAGPFTRSAVGRPVDILYADLFGDHWLYYLGRGVLPNHRYVVGTPLIDTPVPTNNLPALGRYLHGVLLWSLPAAVVGAVAFGWGLTQVARRPRETAPADTPDDPADDRASAFAWLASMATLGTLAGYGWFVTNYATTASDTDVVKATYLVQCLPLLAALVGLLVGRIGRRRPQVARGLALLLVVVALANAGTWLTRCPSLH